MKKMDEMELKIATKSIKITWFITVIALYIIGFIQKYNSGEGNIFLTIATSSVFLNLFLHQYYLSKVDDDRNFIRFVGIVGLLALVILLGLWWLSR